MKSNQIKLYFGIAIILAFGGLVVSAYLAFSHYRVFTDIEYKSFCAISKALNCDTVSQSRYAVFLGVPVAAWGMVGYLFFLACILLFADTKGQRARGTATLFILSLLFSVISLIFGIISSFYIHAYCLMCIVTYIVNFSLLYLFWLFHRRLKEKPFLKAVHADIDLLKSMGHRVGFVLISFFVVVGILMFYFPDYWNFKAADYNASLPTGVMEDGSPWIGSENPKLTIVEFTDYRCFQCKKMSFFLKSIVSQYPDKIRLVHRHFPMDRKYNPLIKETLHPGSGLLALIAISAAKLDRFWEANDYLFHYDFSKGAIYLQQIADDLEIDLQTLRTLINSGETRYKLIKDIQAGAGYKIEGTPTYVIDGEVYTGQIPLEIFDSLKTR